MPNNPEKYRGKRALILTRVSTPDQEKKFSHAAQERQVREKLIIPLGLRIVDEKKHVIHDTYSGLEYRYRKALEDILEMAERAAKTKNTTRPTGGYQNSGHYYQRIVR